ncbi:Conserved_hypothetical protein [Hexamita inflata]|uniref:Uncharacterized protein n=1 Tax=Hexamita inflata TaxID=28002 RepID=A0AA86Q491_9EUKA|nr:Conserved hypothetical protein [Hexamita inflata]
MSDCGWMTLGRIWSPKSPCILDDVIDLGSWKNYGLNFSGNSTDVDMSVVNVNQLAEMKSTEDTSVHFLAMLTEEAQVSNAVFVVNVSIDCEQKKFTTKRLLISIFDSVYGQINNVTVVGNVNLKNLDFATYDEVLLSSFFGNVALEDSDRLMNGTDGLNGRLQTIFSSLRFIVNDTYEVRQTTEGKIVLKSLKPLLPHITNETYLEKIHLVNCFDSMIKSDDETSINIPYIPSDLDKELNKNVVDEILTTDDLNITLASLYGPKNIGGFDIFVPEVPQSVLAVVRNYTTIDMTIQDSFTDATYTIPATIGFNMTEHPNAFHDLYGRALTKSIELSHETEGLSERFYNMQGIEQNFINPEDPSIKVYTSSTKTVAIWEGHILVCQDGKLFNVMNRSCEDNCTKGQFRFLSICAAGCPEGFYTIETDNITHCYFECPVQSGYINPLTSSNSSLCVQCPYMASSSGCISIPQKQMSKLQGINYRFNKGYFSNCPEGTIITDEINCSEPQNISDCNPVESEEQAPQKIKKVLVDMREHPFHISKGYEYYSFCTDKISLYGGLHRMMNAERLLTDVYHWKCPKNSIQFLNGTCFASATYDPQLKDCVTTSSVDVFASISYVQAALNETIGDVLICEPICGNGFVEVDGACVAECPVPLYMQERFGSCNPCISNVYDNGTYFNLDTKHCNIECANFTIDVDHSETGSQQFDTAPKLCLEGCTGKYPKHWVRNYTALDNTIKTHWQCLEKCSDVQLLDNDGECVEKCPLGKLISEDGTTCLEKCPMTIGSDGKPREGFYRVMLRNGTTDNTTSMWQGQCYTSPVCPEDLQTIDEKVHNISYRCMDTCPVSPNVTIATRYFTCIPLDECQFVDRYPKPLFCEEKTDPNHCPYYRKIDLITDRKVYDCQTVECENNERIFEKQECVLSCYDHNQFQSAGTGRFCVEKCKETDYFYSKVYQSDKGTASVLLDPTKPQAYELQCKDECPFPNGWWQNPNSLFKEQELGQFQVYKQCEESCSSMLNSTEYYVNVKDQKCSNCTYLDTQYSPPMCVDKCEVSMMAPAPLNKKICVDKCPENNYIHTVNGVKECVSSCKAIGMAVSNDGIYCVDECVFYRYQNGEFFCYDMCLDYDNYLQIDNKTYCYPDCGNQNYDPVADKCVDKCPNGTYSYYRLCLTSCPAGYTNANGQCIIASNKISSWLYIVFIGAAVVVVSIVTILIIVSKNKRKQTKHLRNVEQIGKNTAYYSRRLDVGPKKVARPVNKAIEKRVEVNYTNDPNTSGSSGSKRPVQKSSNSHNSSSSGVKVPKKVASRDNRVK